jgi:hypothetical protein
MLMGTIQITGISVCPMWQAREGSIILVRNKTASGPTDRKISAQSSTPGDETPQPGAPEAGKTVRYLTHPFNHRTKDDTGDEGDEEYPNPAHGSGH